jgi:hypothetical protein
MDTVMLPLVWSRSEINQALEEARLRRRAGVVRYNPDDTYTLFYLSDLGRARIRGLTFMEQVPGGHPAALLDTTRAAALNLDLVRPSLTAPAFERVLADMGLDFAVAGQSRDMVMIVTLHERQTDSLSTGGYECSGTPTHYFPDPDVSDGQLCPLRPECSAAPGQPTIRPRS